jgi:xanthine dehydrogenase YagT iron-sulfur-binding subunit
LRCPMPESNPLPENAAPHGSPTRREFLATTSGAVIAGVLLPTVSWAAPGDAAEPSPPVRAMNIILRVNGLEHHLQIDTRVSLLDLLREHLRLTGSKKGCNHGQCGACTVLVNGERINSCLALAVCHDGDEVTTVEGLANGNELHPLEAAFIKHDGFQCGYCTPGQICSAVAMLDEVRRKHRKLRHGRRASSRASCADRRRGTGTNERQPLSLRGL